MPAVANGRAPKRSENNPEVGPAIRNPAVSGSMKMPAQSGVLLEAVSVLRQPDPLQPDDQHEHQAAARTAERNVESVPNVNARIRNSCSRNIG